MNKSKHYISTFKSQVPCYERLFFAIIEKAILKNDRNFLHRMYKDLTDLDILTILPKIKDITFKAKQMEPKIVSFLSNLKECSLSEFYISFKKNLEDNIINSIVRMVLLRQLLILNSHYSSEDLLNKVLENNLSFTNDLTFIFLFFFGFNLICFKNDEKDKFEYQISNDQNQVIYTKNKELNFDIIHFTNAELDRELYIESKEKFLIEEDVRVNVLHKSLNPIKNEEIHRQNMSLDLSTLNSFLLNLSKSLDLNSKATLDTVSKSYKDIKNHLYHLFENVTEEKESLKELEQNVDILVYNTEKIKTHLYKTNKYVIDDCSVCGKKCKDIIMNECVRNKEQEKIIVYCENCFKSFLKWRLYIELGMPYLTLPCFQRDECMHRMIFTEESLVEFFDNKEESTDFLHSLVKLREKYNNCFNCGKKNPPDEIKMVLKCKYCFKKTCKVCWEEAHEDNLCKFLKKECRYFFGKNFFEKVFVCSICFSVSVIMKLENSQDIRCENCHRNFCGKCFQSTDSITNHGPFLHEIDCKYYNNKKNNYDDSCDICDMKESKCHSFNYRKFVGE